MDENAADAPPPPEPRNLPENEKDQKKAPAKSPSGELDPFLLGRLYPEPHNVLKPTAAVDPSSADVVVALDTNALLLPYQLSKSDLAGLATVYAKLAGESPLSVGPRPAKESVRSVQSTPGRTGRDAWSQ